MGTDNIEFTIELLFARGYGSGNTLPIDLRERQLAELWQYAGKLPASPAEFANYFSGEYEGIVGAYSYHIRRSDQLVNLYINR